MKTTPLLLAVCGLFTAHAAHAQANIQITEWMYNGNGGAGEYVEFTNLGTQAADFTGWSFDDDSRTPGAFSLSALGIVQPGQSVLMTEASAAVFRSTWLLAASVAVVGDNTNNLGRTDEINIFNAAGTLVDRLAYSDQNIPGTVRAQNFSGNPTSLADLLPLAVTPAWVLAATGDAFGSYTSTGGDVGNPGFFALAVPEPAGWALWLLGAAAVAGASRRARRNAA